MFGLLSLLGCSPDAGSEGDAGDEGVAPESFDTPEFLEPANAELTLAVDRTEDLEFMVRGIHPGLTRVLVDERSVGIAQGESGVATLSPESFTLRLAGAMLVGRHTVQLRTVAPSEVLETAPVALIVTPAEFTGFSASLDEAPAFEADVIMTHGHGDQGVLLGLDLAADTVTTVVAPADGDAWATDDSVTLELPGFDRTDEPRFTVSAALRSHDETRRVRLAWRTGDEGRVVLGSDILWPPASIQVQRVADLAEQFQGFEYGKLGRPLLLGDTLVVEALLTHDVEQAVPGDRTLLVSHVDPETGHFAAPTISAVGQGKDIDRIEPVRDLATFTEGGVPGLSARVAGLRPVVFDVDASTGTLSERPSGANDRFSSLANANGPPQTILGSLQSRHVFVPVEADTPRVFLRQFDDRLLGEATDASPDASALSMLQDITAPVTSTVVGGLPVFLVPQGPDAPTVALVGVGPTARPVALDGLACDELAVPITPETFDSRAVGVACRRGREVFIGTLALAETP